MTIKTMQYYFHSNYVMRLGVQHFSKKYINRTGAVSKALKEILQEKALGAVECLPISTIACTKHFDDDNTRDVTYGLQLYCIVLTTRSFDSLKGKLEDYCQIHKGTSYLGKQIANRWKISDDVELNTHDLKFQLFEEDPAHQSLMNMMELVTKTAEAKEGEDVDGGKTTDA
eukprot:10642_1